jgi:hypothetical protein
LVDSDWQEEADQNDQAYFRSRPGHGPVALGRQPRMMRQTAVNSPPQKGTDHGDEEADRETKKNI